jgi:hypothetical protein
VLDQRVPAVVAPDPPAELASTPGGALTYINDWPFGWLKHDDLLVQHGVLLRSGFRREETADQGWLPRRPWSAVGFGGDSTVIAPALRELRI